MSTQCWSLKSTKMESTWRKLEDALDVLCETVIGEQFGIDMSGDLYNMIFEEQYDQQDVISFIDYCKQMMLSSGRRPDFDEWEQKVRPYIKK